MLRTNHIGLWFGTVILSSLSGLFLCLQAGCSIHVPGYTAVNSGNLEGRAGITTPNSRTFRVRSSGLLTFVD